MQGFYNNPRQPVKIALYPDEPLAFKCFPAYPSDKCPIPGFEVEYIYTVVNGILKLPIQWILANSKEEMQQMVSEGRADIAGSALPMNSVYVDTWGFPPPNYIHDNIMFIVKENDAESAKFFSLLKDFKWDLWLCIAVASLLLFFARWASKQLQRIKCYDDSPFLKIYAKTSYFLRANLFYSVWFVLLSFILNFYSNLIAVDLIRPNIVKTYPFTTLDDLGEKLLTNRCRLVMLNQYKNSYEFHNFVIDPMEHRQSWASMFSKAYQTNKPLYAVNRSDMVDIIQSDKCIVGLDYGTMDSFYTTRYCDLKLITKSDELPMFGYTFYTTREDIKEGFATVILSSPFQKYPEYLYRKYFSNPVPPWCLSKTDSLKTIDVTLTLAKVKDCFYVLLIGLIVSSAFLVGQTVMAKLKQNKLTKIVYVTDF